MRILVLEDDRRLGRGIADRLRKDAYAVDLVVTLAEAQEAYRTYDYDLLILDRKVPGGDGLELAEEAREAGDQVPVLVLSGFGSSSDRIEGLMRGADDYLSKPVRLEELVLRVSKLLVRKAVESGGSLRVGRVCIDPERRQAFIDEEPVKLSRTQFGVLEYLFLQGGRPVSAEELLEHVWDRNADPFSSAVPPLMTRLRAIFAGVLEFENVREVGYTAVPVEADDESTETHGSKGRDLFHE